MLRDLGLRGSPFVVIPARYGEDSLLWVELLTESEMLIILRASDGRLVRGGLRFVVLGWRLNDVNEDLWGKPKERDFGGGIGC
jgi:hypothetical protein